MPYEKKGLDLFEKLIAANIPNLSIVMISRETPRVPLAGMLSKGLMTLITEDDLRFSRDEMEDYFRMQGETLGTASSSYLYDYTEGWILAIKLMGVSLKRGKFNNQNPLLQFKVDIFALIEEEIYRFSSDEMKKFLIVLALLDDPPTGLVKELAMDKPEILAEMTNPKFLIRYDPHAKCYRMHNVLKDFLSEKMDLLTYEEARNVHFIAARWYKDHHHPEEAVNHYMKCDCYSEIFDIILSVRNRVTKDVADLFIILIEQSPDWIVSLSTDERRHAGRMRSNLHVVRLAGEQRRRAEFGDACAAGKRALYLAEDRKSIQEWEIYEDEAEFIGESVPCITAE